MLIESAWVLFRLGAWSGKIRLGWSEGSVVPLLDLEGCAHVDFAVTALVVPPPHVLDDRDPELFDCAPRTWPADQLRLVQVVDRLSEGAIASVADGSRRGHRLRV
jgi:hypothetical protein